LKHKDSTASILEFLRIEKKCYDQVLSLLKEQTEAIEQEDEKTLDAVLKKKDGILQTARDNGAHLKTAVAQLSGKDLAGIEKQAGALKNEIESVLAQIIEMENNCQAELQARKFLAQDKIFDLKQKRNLLKGYGTSQRIKPKISKNV
jgi:hypothetical protein